ncbi:shikimate dehydrogenase [Roseisolibacter sp. H3M3-2]|uniref:shikimate dehydrogenase family protein n=1 Tax=Roseisolibacter sp. H3M3-2 TaxID=3031323 RepID=UPI0023DB22D2|nr:shikimate dehydrogenase [Roseisolibacter sp. H3M3-2]MDF1501491.1 shikimate dehydrogenase [Roseisolibacter sp. H3M3-2]
MPPDPASIRRLVLLGHPVAHSLSPAFQNAALRAAGLAPTYAALDVAPAALGETLARLVAEGAAGNATIPHKEAVAARCDVRSAVAERVGAVNTWWRAPDGALVGDNTDVAGVAAAVAERLGRAPDAPVVALLGAGGSAGAVLAAAERWPGARVRVWSRTADRARALAERFGAEVAASPAQAVRGASLVVNATPLGLRDDDPFPVAAASLESDAAVLDLVYRRGETAWVRAARALARPAADGLTMLIAQGAAAFTRWFGVPPDLDAMWGAVGGRPGAPRGR